MNIIKGASAIQKAITSIAGRGGKLDKDIHVAGVSVLQHASEHGDTTLADKLVLAMPKGSRKLALVEWMLAFGQVAKLDPALDKDRLALGQIFKLDKTRNYDEAGAVETTWTDFRREPDVSTAFDVQAAVHNLLERMKRAHLAGLTIEGRAQALVEARLLVEALANPIPKVPPAEMKKPSTAPRKVQA